MGVQFARINVRFEKTGTKIGVQLAQIYDTFFAKIGVLLRFSSVLER